MKSLQHLYSKFFKKVLRGKSVINCQIDDTAYINSGCTIYDCSMRRYSYMGYDCQILNTDIGSFCSIASGVHIGEAEHPTEWVSTSPVFQKVKNSSIKKRFAQIELPPSKRTIIGHDVWIGTNAIIKQGVHIGTGAVIASGAIVTKDVEPYAIVGGCPAKVIKYRFNNEVIQQLLLSEWWDYNEPKLVKLGKFANRPNLFIKAAVELKGKREE